MLKYCIFATSNTCQYSGHSNMVPLIMSVTREDNQSSTFEEFGTHLSLYDDSFQFVEKPVSAISAPMPVMEDSQGPLPPSVFYPISKNVEDASGQVKVKRKCGRPRNPIPRHKRESHINAEHRRRGKIQDGFRTLKGIVPKYEQSSGRDSKADILFKAVDYCKLLQNDIKELGSSIEALRAEKDAISVDIKNYKTIVPDLSLYDQLSVTIDDRFTDYVQCKSKENWTFGTFKVIMRPLFESYKLSVRGESWGEFLRSVADWAATSLSLSNLRTVCLTTLRDVPAGFSDVDQFKVGHSNSGYGAASLTAKPTISDTNNNNRLSGQSLTPELFGCENMAANSNKAGWNRTAEVDVNNHSFGNTQNTTNRCSPMTKGSSCLNMQNSEDLVSFPGDSLDGSNIFGDLYYNLGNDLHHHQLNLARAGMNHWPNLHFRQQHGQYYQNSHMSSSRYCSDFRESHHFWGSHHQQLSQHMVGDHNLAPAHYQQQVYPLPEREYRYDLSGSRERLETLPVSAPYLGGHSAHFLDPDLCRRKRLSQSSSGSEGSLLNMDLFARKATETLVEHEKLSQLSPSTDSCVSSGSSAYIPSPGVLNGRNADYACSYRNASSLDNFKQNKSVTYERVDSLDNQLALSSSTYRDIFGVGAAELHKNSVNRLDEQQKTSVNRLDEQLKTFTTRHDGDIRSSLCVKTVPTTGCRQPPSARPDSSSLLAEMLGQQQSQLLKTWSAQHCVDTLLSAPTHQHSATNTLPVTSSNPSTATHFVNEPVKKESAYITSSHPPGENLDYPHTVAKDQHSPLSTTGQRSTSFHFQTNETQINFSGLDIKTSSLSNSSWLYPYPKSQTTSDFNASTKLKQGRNQHLTVSPSQASYFEMAHQKLLQNQFYSTHNNNDVQAQLSDLTKLQKESCQIPKQEDDLFVCKATPTSNMQAPAQFLDTSSQLTLQAHCPAFMEASSRLKIGRKSPFGNGDPEDEQLEAVSASKKACQRHEPVKGSLLRARQYSDTETMAEI